MTGAALNATLSEAAGRQHALLRFGVGTTAGFVLCEAMGWAPTMIMPLFTAVLLANLPGPPPLKVGVVLAAVMGLSAYFAFALTSLLLFSPLILVGCIAVVVFAAFYLMAQGKAALPMTLLLMCIAVIPVVTMTGVPIAHLMPSAMARGMALAVAMVWIVYGIWPRRGPSLAAAPALPRASPLRAALVSTAILVPLVAAYLLLGLANAVPVLVVTVLLLTSFDPRLGALQGLSRVAGALLGGLLGAIGYMLLSVAPSLPMLALLTFLLATIAAVAIARGGSAGMTALLSFNTYLVIFSNALLMPDSSDDSVLKRFVYFCLAWLFAVGMMVVAQPSRARLDGESARESADARQHP